MDAWNQFLQKVETIINEKQHTFPNPDLLWKNLQLLDQMTGMNSAKLAIMKQLKSLLIDDGMFKNHKYLLHTVINGPPGVGKTELGKILAGIWTAMGLVQAKVKKEDPELELLKYKLLSMINFSKKQDTLEKLQVLKSKSIQQRKFLQKRNKLTAQNWEELELNNREIRNLLRDLEDEFGQPDPEVDITIIETEKSKNSNMKIVSREDFVAGYLGQTAIKTRKLLDEHRGQVLFIDEAYSLINSNTDSFGMEALTELNAFMSENPGEIIVIFAGYKELMEKTIFEAQPGLKSRCNWVFDIPGYTPQELSQIFLHQMENANLKLESELDVEAFFIKHVESFPAFGRDTSQLVLQCRLLWNSLRFDDPATPEWITAEILKSATTSLAKIIKDEKIPDFMYS